MLLINIMNPETIEITHGSNNVFADLGFAPAEAENLKIRADLMLALRERIQTQGWSIEQAAATLQSTTACMGDLLQGEIDRFTVDQLIQMLTQCGCQVAVQVTPIAA
jgi:predicted XRE-type DNA-binding protein